MVERPLPIAPARQLLKLAQEDVEAARAVMAGLPIEQQVAAVCEAPLSMRGRVLDLCAEPETVVPLIPAAELCFTCRAVGVEDSSWILALATDEQMVACIDLDAWTGLLPDVGRLDHWVASLAEAGDETLLRGAQSMDPEMLALYLGDHVGVVLKPSGDEDWEPPEGGQTLEGQFYVTARRDGDDLAPLLRLIRVLFENDYWLYFRMLQSVIEESRTEIEEWALRWRTGRLEDLGFPSWDRAMRIYGHLRPDHLADLPIEPQDIEHTRWQLPVWIDSLPVAADSRFSLFRAAGQLDAEGRGAFFYAFMSLANKVAVADRCDLGDAETLPRTIEKAAQVTSRGLEHVARENGLDLVEVLRRVPVDRLFRIGVNLAPEGVRPGFSDDPDDERHGEAPA